MIGITDVSAYGDRVPIASTIYARLAPWGESECELIDHEEARYWNRYRLRMRIDRTDSEAIIRAREIALATLAARDECLLQLLDDDGIYSEELIK